MLGMYSHSNEWTTAGWHHTITQICTIRLQPRLSQLRATTDIFVDGDEHQKWNYF